MSKVRSLPDLKFPKVEYGPYETPWDLRVLLYKGGSRANPKKVDELIRSGELGEPCLERLDLVVQFHDQISGDLAAGKSRSTAKNRVAHLRYFFDYGDIHDLPLSLSAVTDTFCLWAGSLHRRTKLTEKVRRGRLGAITMSSAYASAAMVGVLLNRILGRSSNIVELTGLRAPPQGKPKEGGKAEKQNFDDTFAFGHLLLDICDALTIAAIKAANHPYFIQLRTGQSVLAAGDDARTNRPTNKLINLRIEAEFEFFIAQTGMNVAPAIHLELRHFAYRPYGDDYQVVDYKERREGTVLFVVYKEYRPHFDRYLLWRREFSSESNRYLFPFTGNHGTRQEERYKAHRTGTFCKLAGVMHVSPQMLRGARLNWFLRQTGSSETTSDALQTGIGKVDDVYRWANEQESYGQLIRFWSRADPALNESIAPGGCTGQPSEVENKPKDAPTPECAAASGCLWCEDHRDVESFDYVWAMTSFKHLKLIGSSRFRVGEKCGFSYPREHAGEDLKAQILFVT